MTTAPVNFQPRTVRPTFVPTAPITSGRDAPARLLARAASAARWLENWPVAGIGAFVAIGAIVLVHILTSASVDPTSSPLSTYALSTRSSWLFALACGALGLAVCFLARHLPTIGRWSAYTAAVMLKAVVIFPTDPATRAATLSLSAQIHRYTAGAAFVLLGVAILAAANHCGKVMRRWVLFSCVVVALMFGLTLAATFWPDYLAMAHWRGIPQRIMLLVEAGAIGALGMYWHRTRTVRGSSAVGNRGVRNSVVNPAG